MGALVYAAVAFAATGQLTPKGCWGDPTFNPAGCTRSATGLADGQIGGQPNAVAVSSDGKSLYTASQSSSGYAVVMFARNPSTGGLVSVGCIGETGENPGCAQTTAGLHTLHSIALSPDGSSLYAYGDAIVHFQRDASTSALTPVDCVGESGNNTEGCSRTARALGRHDIPTENDIAVSSDGKSVYAVGQQAILRLSRDATTGSLKPISCVADAANNPAGCANTAPVLGNPQNLALTSDGRSLYVTSLGALGVVHFQRSSTGALTFIGCVKDPSSSAACSKSAKGLFGPIAVAPSPDGTSLYVTAIAGDSTIVRFARNTTNGALTPKGCVGVDADSQCASDPGDVFRPQTLAISADGNSLYAAGDEDVVWFTRLKSGLIRQLGCVGDVTSNNFSCARTAKGIMSDRESLGITPDGTRLYDGTGRGLVVLKRSP